MYENQNEIKRSNSFLRRTGEIQKVDIKTCCKTYVKYSIVVLHSFDSKKK